MSRISRRDFAKLMTALSVAPLLSAPGSSLQEGARAVQPGAPNIIFLVFDTLSARHMSLYGYRRETTPNLARFAERANVYHAHHSGGNFTTPGTASLLTGNYPWSHRAFNHTGLITESFIPNNLFRAFSSSGYYRTAYTHNHLAYLILYQFRAEIDELLSPSAFTLYDGQVGEPLFKNDTDMAYRAIDELVLRRGEPPGSLFLSLLDRIRLRAQKRAVYRDYSDLFPRGTPELFKMSFILEDVIDGLHQQLTSLPKPFLAYFHVLPPHEPYMPRKDFIDIFRDGWQPETKEVRYFHSFNSQKTLNWYRRQYDEYLAYADAEFGRWLEMLDQDGYLDNSYVVFTSDHGQLFERESHGHVSPLMYEGLLNVPLLISRPGQQHREDFYQLTSCVDILPTLLHLADQPIPDWCAGRLLPGFGEAAEESDRTRFAVEAKGNPREAALTKASLVMFKGSHKLIEYRGYNGVPEAYELYNLENDPEELEDLVEAQPSLLAEMKQQLTENLVAADEPYRNV